MKRPDPTIDEQIRAASLARDTYASKASEYERSTNLALREVAKDAAGRAAFWNNVIARLMDSRQAAS